MLPYEPEQPPALEGVDVLVDAGEHDPYSPPAELARLVELLSAGGATVTAHREPGAGHGLTQNDVAVTARWLAALLSPAATGAAGGSR
jgi:phospholipase/carboxylesterase